MEQNTLTSIFRSLDSIAHIVHRLQVDYQGIVVQFPVQEKGSFSPQRFQTGSAAHPATYSMGVMGAVSRGTKRS